MTSAIVMGDSYAYAPPPTGEPGMSTIGNCTLSFAGRVLQFRTNPNSIWWSYELLKNIDYTYGGQVVQLLGTRLGDLKVKVDCGRGGWPYLVQVAMFLRDLLAYQRGGNTATFLFMPRNWKLNVYGMSIPFSDQLTATTREIELSFKIQEDISGTLSQITIDTEIMRLNEGIYMPGILPHNMFDDPSGIAGNLDALSGGMVAALSGQGMADAQTPSGPSYSASGISNPVDTDPEGQAGNLLGNLGGPLNDLLNAANIPTAALGGLPIGDD